MDQQALNIKLSLEYWVPGYTTQDMLRLCPDPQKQFNPNEFIQSLKKGQFQVQIQDDKSFSSTEQAFHYAHSDKRVRSDYECMFLTNDVITNDPPEQQIQKCVNPECQGTDQKWIECSYGKCWYHQSCAGIPQNKTQEEIDQMEWICKKCKIIKAGKKR
ncbi:hypothetical protein pb186bvf_014117 [Paramecium bursaria]